MIFKVNDTYVNTDHIIYGRCYREGEKEGLTLSLVEGERLQLIGKDADYVKTLLESLHYLDVENLKAQLPKKENTY